MVKAAVFVVVGRNAVFRQNAAKAFSIEGEKKRGMERRPRTLVFDA